MNIADIHDCYGCGVCATVCPRHIIEIRLNGDGFYEPLVTDKTICTGCGLCVDVCSYANDGLSLKSNFIKSYAAWSNDDNVRYKCSSGGVGFEIGRVLIQQGYKVCGVRYNTDINMAEHYIATTVEELIPSIGSKYIQSYTVDGFKAIHRKEKYLVTGTPCQIDSFRRYVQKFRCEDNFVLLDFFCHGVPSMLMWRKYVAWTSEQVGKLTYVSWRNKLTGWHDSWAMLIDGEKTSLYSQLSRGDMFYRLFLGDSCLGKACYGHCKFKYANSSADIRIGDLWGDTYKGDEYGVSAVVAFTEKGDAVLHQCNCTIVEHPFEVVAEGQMKTCPDIPPYAKDIWEVLRDESATITQAISVIKRFERIKSWKGRVTRLLHMVGIRYK